MHAASLVDAKDAWPAPGHLHLDGFTFYRFGGADEDTGNIMRNRGAQWWDSWARRDPIFSPALYDQLAAAFVTGGMRNAADDVKFLGRVREQSGKRTAGWLWSLVLEYVVGYEIGDYTFRLFYWLAGATFALAAYMYWRLNQASSRRERVPFVQCLNASLDRIFPWVRLHRIVMELFNVVPDSRLNPGTDFFIGMLIGALTAAAVAGLTQG
jgi:hypothetical protein